jgi:(p)ppGpp synthase/HD superfamily hydrolase
MTVNTQIPWYVTWCIQAHELENQKYGEDKYEVHLGEVNGVAVEFGFVNVFLALLLWAHDVGEDCKNPATGEKYTLAELIAVGFPAIVAAAILAITDQEGKDRDEIKAKTLPIIAAFVVVASAEEFPVRRPVVLAKLCDRIANLRRGKPSKGSKYRRYQHEDAQFVADLYDPTEVELKALWDCYFDLIADEQYSPKR